MVKEFKINENAWVVFRDDSITIYEDHGREGGPVVERDTWDILNQKENDRKFVTRFSNYVLKNCFSSEKFENIIDTLNEYDFVKHLDEDAPTYEPVVTFYEVRNIVRNGGINSYETTKKITARCSLFANALEILATSHNDRTPRPGKKPFAIGSGFIFKVDDYVIDGLPVRYESMVFSSTHDCVPERLSEFETTPRRVE